MGDVQVANAELSKLHWKVELDKVDVKPKEAEAVFTVPEGPDVMVVSGAVTLTVHD